MTYTTDDYLRMLRALVTLEDGSPDAITEGEGDVCWYCSAYSLDGINDPANHEPRCPWVEAVQAVQGSEQPTYHLDGSEHVDGDDDPVSMSWAHGLRVLLERHALPGTELRNGDKLTIEMTVTTA